MSYVNNHFTISQESRTYEIVADGIVGEFSETYIKDQYVRIQGSVLNDGVYEVESVTSEKVTFIEANLLAENTTRSILFSGLAPSREFISLVAEIKEYDETVVKGVKSESQGNRSVSYGTGGGSGSSDNSWESVFASQLVQYRKLVDSTPSGYNIYTKGW